MHGRTTAMVLCAIAIAIASCRASSPRTSPARTTVPVATWSSRCRSPTDRVLPRFFNQIVVHWLRVVRRGSFEMLSTTRPGNGTAATTTWTKQVCTRLEIPAVDLAPLRIVSERRVVETA